MMLLLEQSPQLWSTPSPPQREDQTETVQTHAGEEVFPDRLVKRRGPTDIQIPKYRPKCQ